MVQGLKNKKTNLRKVKIERQFMLKIRLQEAKQYKLMFMPKNMLYINSYKIVQIFPYRS